MPDKSKGPQQLRDRLVQARVYRERDRFIASIHEEDVLNLASSHHDGRPCTFFKPPARGSYNICYFVQFRSDGNISATTAATASDQEDRQDEVFNEDEGEKWVVRVPLAPCLAFGGRYKLESEIATMKLIAEKTTIPIPTIHAYALSDDPAPLSSFLILEYIDGQKLGVPQLSDASDEKRRCLYTSLADIYIQLRRLEFPSIGCLVQGPDGPEVCKRNSSIDINMQEVEGAAPSEIQATFYGSDGILKSANSYAEMQLQIAYNAFVKNRGTVWNEKQGTDALYHLHIFRNYARGWVNRSLDQGPFVLAHGDLEPFNLLVNDELDIIAVLDWEWSRVVPRQYFIPPWWLKLYGTTNMAYGFVYESYLERLDQLLSIVRVREFERYGDTLLSDEWEEAKKDSGILVANALENWTDIDWFANRFINREIYRGASLEKRIRAFLEEDPERGALIARKIPEGIAYNDAVDRLKRNNSCALPQDTEGKNDEIVPLLTRPG